MRKFLMVLFAFVVSLVSLSQIAEARCRVPAGGWDSNPILLAYRKQLVRDLARCQTNQSIDLKWYEAVGKVVENRILIPRGCTWSSLPGMSPHPTAEDICGKENAETAQVVQHTGDESVYEAQVRRQLEQEFDVKPAAIGDALPKLSSIDAGGLGAETAGVLRPDGMAMEAGVGATPAGADGGHGVDSAVGLSARIMNPPAVTDTEKPKQWFVSTKIGKTKLNSGQLKTALDEAFAACPRKDGSEEPIVAVRGAYSGGRCQATTGHKDAGLAKTRLEKGLKAWEERGGLGLQAAGGPRVMELDYSGQCLQGVEFFCNGKDFDETLVQNGINAAAAAMTPRPAPLPAPSPPPVVINRTVTSTVVQFEFDGVRFEAGPSFIYKHGDQNWSIMADFLLELRFRNPYFAVGVGGSIGHTKTYDSGGFGIGGNLRFRWPIWADEDGWVSIHVLLPTAELLINNDSFENIWELNAGPGAGIRVEFLHFVYAQVTVNLITHRDLTMQDFSGPYSLILIRFGGVYPEFNHREFRESTWFQVLFK